jgi:hypothetical protein
MNRIKLLLLAIITGSFSLVHAQNEMDALRFSQFFYGSTARSMSMGGAFTALGGDFSTLGLNPGGIGVYRAGEFSITPVFNFNQATANYLDTSTDEFKYSFGIENLGFVGVLKTGRESGWISTNFGIGFNRVQDFNRNIIMRGYNPYTSMADYFLDWADGTYPEDLDPYWERLAFDSYVIDTISFPNFYETYVPLGTEHNQTRNYSGSMTEWNFSLGGNFDNKLFIGASLGIVSVFYSDRYSHTETDVNDFNDFTQFTFRRRVTTNGSGFNFKFGAIYKPIEFIRIGGSIHLPTFFKLEDEESSSMESQFDTGEFYQAYPTTSTGARMGSRFKEYAIHSPLRANAGAALIFGKRGLVSVDYEYVDYSIMRLRETDGEYDYLTENDQIRASYKPTSNLRLGAEYRLGNIALRGGLARYGSPFQSNQMNADASYFVKSLGIGVRESNFFADFGYAISSLNENEYLYYYEGMPEESLPSENSYKRSSFKLTVGFRF